MNLKKIAGLALVALLLSACQFSLTSGLARSLTVSWQFPVAKTLVPTAYPIPATYDVVLTPPAASPVSQAGIATSSWVFTNLPPAVYTIQVTGRDGGGNVLVTGTGSADMTLATPPTPNITLNYIATGAGTGQIHLTFDCTGLGVTTNSLTLVDPSGATLVNAAPLSGASPTFFYTNTAASVGTYKVSARFSTATNQFALKLDTALVVQNVDTAATITVAPSDLQDQTFRLFALEMKGTVWSSFDWGKSWASRGYPAPWQELAASGDGMTIVAAAGGYSTPSSIFRSTDGGLSWATTAAAPHNYNGLGSSDDGTILGAAVYDGSSNFYYSKDSGASWGTTTIAGGAWWSTPMASADGLHWIFCNGGDSNVNVWVWTGTYDGASGWSWAHTPYGYTNAGSLYPVGYGISKDGQKLLVAFANAIHLSPDFGTTWNPVPLPPAAVAAGILQAAISGDGNTILAAGVNHNVYITTNAGATWTTSSVPAFLPLGGTINTAEDIRFVALSYDGSKMAFSTVWGSTVMPVTSGSIYTSLDGGATFTKNLAGGNRFWWGLTIQSR